ncbi:MAG: nucleoside deaminase [Clostridia bacterium]
MNLQVGETMKVWMELALAQAILAAAKGEVPVGAVIVRDGRLIASAHNEKEALQDVTAHAELLAMRRANALLGSWRLDNCELYVTLEPCAMCAGTIAASRLKRLVYGAMDVKCGGIESNYQLLSPNIYGGTIEIYSGIMEEECRELLSGFFAERRQVK